MLIRKYPEFQSIPATTKKWDTALNVAKHIVSDDAITPNQQDSVALNCSIQPHFGGPSGGQDKFVKAAKEGDINAFHTHYWDSDIGAEFYYSHMNSQYPSRREMAGYHEGGSTLMHLAAKHGHVAIMKWLESNTPSSPAGLSKDKSRITPMHEAAANNQTQVLQYLHETKSLPLESQDALGRTPLYHAVMNNHVQAAQYLVRNGALISNKILEVARKNNYTQIRNLLEYAPKEQLREPVQRSWGFLSSSSSSSSSEVDKLKAQKKSMEDELHAQKQLTGKYMQRTQEEGGDISSDDEKTVKGVVKLKKKRSFSPATIKRKTEKWLRLAEKKDVSVDTSAMQMRGRSTEKKILTKRSPSGSPTPATVNKVLLYLWKKSNPGQVTLPSEFNSPSTASFAKVTAGAIYAGALYIGNKLWTGSRDSSPSRFSEINERLTRLEEVRDFTEETIRQGSRDFQKTKRRDLLLNAGLFTAGVAGLAISIPLIIFFPPAGALAAAVIGTFSVTTMLPVVKELGKISLKIAENDEFMPETKDRIQRWVGDFKDKLPKLPGSNNVEKRTNELIKRMHNAADKLGRDVNKAKNGPTALKAIQDFLATITKGSFDHINAHGSDEQKEELRVLVEFGENCRKLTGTLNPKPSDDDLEKYGKKLQELATALENMPEYQKLVQAIRNKNVSDLSQKKPGKMSVSELFGDELKTPFSQDNNHTCYLLAPLDCILNYPKAEAEEILNRIKYERIKGGSKVKFPTRTVTVSDDQLRKSGTVQSKFPGPRLIERAYMNYLDVGGQNPKQFSDPITALSKMFFDVDDPPPYAHITIQATNKRDARPIEAQFFNGNFYFWQNGNRKLLTRDQLIETDRQKLRDEISRLEQQLGGGAGQKIYLEQPDKDFRGLGEYKIAEPDQRIGEKGFFHHQRKDELRTYIRNAKERAAGHLGSDDKPLDLDILTAVRADDSDGSSGASVKHYYSVRILESDENRIVLVDPYDTTGDGLGHPKRSIPIDEFLNNYHLQGIRLPRVEDTDKKNTGSLLSSFNLFNK